MRHLNKGRKFGRKKSDRREFVNGLLSNLIMSGRIETTEARAKEIRPRMEKLVTTARRNNVTALRLLMRSLPKPAAYRLYHEIAPRYTSRPGGYLRIVKTSLRRKRDAAPKSIVEFV